MRRLLEQGSFMPSIPRQIALMTPGHMPMSSRSWAEWRRGRVIRSIVIGLLELRLANMFLAPTIPTDYEPLIARPCPMIDVLRCAPADPPLLTRRPE